MQIHSLVQGSPEWLDFRLVHFGASEAAPMLGLSKKVTRTELLHMKSTGTAKEFSDWVQTHILDYGHEVEALARPLAEDLVGDDLYPVTCSEGQISASCDGLTMDGALAWEHKQWAEALAASVEAGIVPDEHMPQCQQILMVTGAERVIFMVSDGTEEKRVFTEVRPSQEWFDRIRAGWAQFERDLADYTPVEYAEKPTARAIMQLPALAVQIRGEVVTSNLPAFKAAATAFIEGIKTDLETDEDFSNADATVKFCESAEKNLELTKSAALGQTASIDELMKTIDYIRDELRAKRLTLAKLVTTKKASIKEDVLRRARDAYVAHIAALDAELRPIFLSELAPRPDFIGAAKNKRTLASLNDAVDTELANAKIAADALARGIRAKLAWCKANAEGYGFLFTDMQSLVSKADEDFQLVVTTRVNEHKRIEDEKAEAQRTSIRDEEEAKARATVAAEQAEPVPVVIHPVVAPIKVPVVAAQPVATPIERPAIRIDTTTDDAPAWTAPEPTTPPTLRLGEIGQRLGFVVTSAFLATLSIEPAGREGAAMLFHETDFDRICFALVRHIEAVAEEHQERQDQFSVA